MAYNLVPYTNFHDLNLDWILRKVKEMDDKTADIDTSVTAAENSATAAANSATEASAAQTAAEAAQGYAESAATSAGDSVTAAQNIVNNALDNIGDGISGAVAEWLDDHVTPSTTVLIDDTLKIAGAAADSRAAGVAVSGLRDFWKTINTPVNWTRNAINASGAVSASTSSLLSDLIAIPNGIAVAIPDFNEDLPGATPFYVSVALYSDENTFVSLSDTFTEGFAILADNGYYFRLMVRYQDSSTLTVANAPFTTVPVLHPTDTDISANSEAGTPGKAADARAVCAALAALGQEALGDASFEALWNALNRGDYLECVEFSPFHTGAPSQYSYSVSGINYNTDFWAMYYRESGDNSGRSSSHWVSNRPFGFQNIRDEEPLFVTVEFDPEDDFPDDYAYSTVYRFDNGRHTFTRITDDAYRNIHFNADYGTYAATSALNIQLGRWTSDTTPNLDAVNARLDYVNNHVHVKFYYPKKTANYLGRSETSSGFTFDTAMEFATKGTSAVTGDKKPMLILCHGLSSTITASEWGSSDDMISLVTNFVADGYFVLDVNRVTAYDWCNPALIHKYIAAINEACKRYNTYPAYVYGESMGSLIALFLAKYYNVKACAIGGCRLDFEATYNGYVSGGNTAALNVINSNLGFTNGFDADIAGQWAKTIPNVNGVNPQSFPPTLFMFGGADTEYYGQENDLAMITRIRKGGNVTETKTYAGATHHQICYLLTGTSYSDVVNWFLTYK